MGIFSELDNLTLNKLGNAFRSSPENYVEYATEYLSELALKIRQKGVNGNEYLMEKIIENSLSESQLIAVILALTFPLEKHKNIQPLTNQQKNILMRTLISLLDDKRPLVVSEAVDGLRCLNEKGIAGDVHNLKNDSSPYVRGSVLRYYSRLFPDEAFNLLLDGLDDAHFIVRENAADELGDLGKVEALPHLRSHLNDEHPHVVKAVQTAIDTLKASAK